MRIAGFVGLVLGVTSVVGFAQSICAPVIQWQKSFGTMGPEQARAVQQMPDGGYIIGGIDADYWAIGGNKTSSTFGMHDFWIVRTDADGNKLWDRSYGGSGEEYFSALDQTADGGFIFAGNTWFDSAGGVKASTNYGNTDYWIVRTDAGGNVLWDRTFGGTWHDYLGDVQQTADGGFVLAGWSVSGTNESKSAPPISGEDFWIVRLDANGQKLWDRSYGGFFNDQARHIRQTADGGFLIGGYWEHGGFGMLDFRVVRIDANGNLLWEKHFGGVARDALLGMTLTSDGGALLGGWSESGRSGNKTAALYGSSDFWVVRVDAQGNKLWDRSYGGTSYDILETLSATSDGGFLLAGYSLSEPSGTKTAPLINTAGYDFWVIRTDASGNELWQETFGGASSEACNATAQTADGGFILVGSSASTDGDRRGTGFGADDYWLVKLTAENPGDCDHDGVPDTQDQCAGTPLGSVVNAQGCSITQLCPCAMSSHEAYLVCVSEQARAFQQAGLINNVRRRQLIENARAADCPPSTGSGEKFIFGLPHRAINYATLDFLPVWFSGLLVMPEPDNPDPWGVSVALGQADSGLFIYPDGGYSSYGEEWFLEATAQGRRAGDDRDDVVSRLRVRKPYYETYPVSVDLSALRPESVTTQILSNNTVISESTQLGSASELTIYGSARLDPRGNPYWRMPDGSVGAIVEFTSPFVFSGNYFSIGVPEPYEEEGLRGNKIFFRANRPQRHVEYINRVDAVAGGGVYSFEVWNERLGMFRHAHQALGAVVFEASSSGLKLRTLEDIDAEDYTAVLVEAPTAASRLEIDFEPMHLEEPGAALTLYPAGALDEDDIMFSVLALKRETNGLAFRCDYQVLFESNSPSVRVEALRNGRPTGSAVVSGVSVSGTFALIDGRAPAITGCRVIINSNAIPTLGISFGRVTTLDIGDGVQLTGNHFRLMPISPARLADSISAVTVEFVKQQSITIIGERSTAAPPILSIQPGDGGELALMWVDNTQLYTLEAAESLSGPFTPITGEVETTSGQHQLTIPISSHGTRFFRLTGPAD